MIDVPGDLVRDLPCVQQASYLEGGPLMWMLPLYLHVYQKSEYDDMMNTPKEDYEQDQVHADAISCPVMLMEGSDPECSAGVGSDSAPLALDVGGLHGPGLFRP